METYSEVFRGDVVVQIGDKKLGVDRATDEGCLGSEVAIYAGSWARRSLVVRPMSLHIASGCRSLKRDLLAEILGYTGKWCTYAIGFIYASVLSESRHDLSSKVMILWSKQ